MTLPRQTLTLAIIIVSLPLVAVAQQSDWLMLPLRTNSWVGWDLVTGIGTTTNGMIVRYGGAVLTAERLTVNEKTGECVAEGDVRIQRDNQVWTGERISYNFKTKQMVSEQFRTGRPPMFAAGQGLHGDMSNRVYTASNAYITTDDVSEPGQRIRASSLRIVPGEYFEARNAVVYVGKVPVFYFPYCKRRSDEGLNRFNFVPGYRSRDGWFLLSTYSFFLNEHVDGAVHVDYREKRGLGTGADANLHLERWGEAAFKYYYADDQDPNADSPGLSIPEDRHRAYFSYNATPFTNLFVKSRASYESDERFLHDFFEGEYRHNPQSSTYGDINKLWPDFSLDFYAQPRINDFLETVERLPEVKLSAFRQRVGPSPFFYESETSGGWYRRLFSETNDPPIPDYSAYRADTFHQLTLPTTFFGWLNVTPRVGGRFTYYDCATATNADPDEITRSVLNTGAELSFKLSRLWPATTSRFLDMNGIRHIVEPALNYSYVPAPDRSPDELPQFDFELPSFRLLPLDFPDYNSIDSIDSQNTLRLRLRNKLQTKREDGIENLVWWDVYTDWRVQQYRGQREFSDLFSDLSLKPRSWMTLASVTRWDIYGENLNMALHSVLLQPNHHWNWGVGHWYLRDGFAGEGSSFIRSAVLYKPTENWAFRAGHYYDVKGQRLREQSYTIYRDLRSWTAGLTFRIRDDIDSTDDISVALTFSLKAVPRFPLGSDSVRADKLLGN
jgi:lipopolysaccharide assembly outer membrane protein LptD (OstA)